MEPGTDPSTERDDREIAYASALAKWREWDQRAVEAQSRDIAVAAQRSLEAVRALERRLDQGAGPARPRGFEAG